MPQEGVTMARDYNVVDVAERIKARRERSGLTVADAARGGNLSLNTLNNYENAASGMSFESAWKLANLYGCSLDELGGRELP